MECTLDPIICLKLSQQTLHRACFDCTAIRLHGGSDSFSSTCFDHSPTYRRLWMPPKSDSISRIPLLGESFYSCQCVEY